VDVAVRLRRAGGVRPASGRRLPRACQRFTRLTYDIAEGQGGVTRLTVTHELDGAPRLAALVAGEMEGTGAGGGWNWVLSGLKTLLETGTPLQGG
jgi:hypothetical protein